MHHLEPLIHAPLARADYRSSRGRVFAVGDIHGCFDALEAALEAVSFDPSADILHFLGDLTDRGPDSAAAVRWLGYDWTRGLLGNHEAMAARTATGSRDSVDYHADEGGRWLVNMPADERRTIARAINNVPVAYDVILPSGRRVGLVHADVPMGDWDNFCRRLETLDGDELLEDVNWAIWSRHRIKSAWAGKTLSPVKGVDHAFFGHTIVRAPETHANCTWIDTGAHATGRVVLVEMDAWLDQLAAAA